MYTGRGDRMMRFDGPGRAGFATCRVATRCVLPDSLRLREEDHLAGCQIQVVIRGFDGIGSYGDTSCVFRATAVLQVQRRLSREAFNSATRNPMRYAWTG